MGLCDSQKQRKGDITYFCDRTERIIREDIKVSKLYIRKDFCPEPKKIHDLRMYNFSYFQTD